MANKEEKRKDIRFFSGTVTLQAIAFQRKPGPADVRATGNTEFELDIIDLPYRLAYTVDRGSITVNVYKRTEIGVNYKSGPVSSVVVNKSTGKAGYTSAQEFNEENLTLFFLTCFNLAKYATDNGLLRKCEDNAGILIESKAGRITSKTVSGNDRPNLMVTKLFGNPDYGRPYEDEIMAQWAIEAMSVEQMEKLAEAGDINVMEQLCQSYLRGDEKTGQDFVKSAYWARKMADTGNSVGMFNLALRYCKGCGVERDYKQAIYWFEKARDAGDEDAARLIEQYRKGEEDRLKAEAGDAQAMADYAGFLVSNGGSLREAGPGKDFEEAFEWAKKSAAQFNLDGIYALALCYEHGRGVEEDCAKAFKLYERAAQKGHAPSMHNLGCLYMNGSGTHKSEKLGLDWIHKAAELKEPNALQSLGRYYMQRASDEKGLHKDRILKAVQYYENLGDRLYEKSDLAFQTATSYSFQPDGLNTLDADLSIFWFKIAADKGHEEAAQMYSILTFVRDNKAKYGKKTDVDMLKYMAEKGLTPNGYSPEYKPTKAEHDRLYKAFCLRNGLAAPGNKTNKTTEKKPADDKQKKEQDREYQEYLKETERKQQEKAEEEKKRKQLAEEKAKKQEEAAEQERKEQQRKAEEKAKQKKERELAECRGKIKYSLPAQGLCCAKGKDFAYITADGHAVCNASYSTYNGGNPGDVSGMSDLCQIYMNDIGVFGLRRDGRVVVSNIGRDDMNKYGYNACLTWKNIKKIAGFRNFIVGLRYDGTCVGTKNISGTESAQEDNAASGIEHWKDITDLVCGAVFTAGLKADGTVCYSGAGKTEYWTNNFIFDTKLKNKLEKSWDWKDIVQIYAPGNQLIGIQKDGTMLMTAAEYTEGLPEVNRIVDIKRGTYENLTALPIDGRLPIAKADMSKTNGYEELFIDHVLALYSSGSNYIFVLKENGDLEEYGYFNKRYERDFKKLRTIARICPNYSEYQRKERERIAAIETAEQKRREEEALRTERRAKGVCQHCGGELQKNIFGWKCKSCGKKKDY